jgi:hypothetical protein
MDPATCSTSLAWTRQLLSSLWIRGFAIVGCAWLFASSALCAEKGAPIDYDFLDAAGKGDVSVREMLQRLNSAMPSPGKSDDESSLFFAETYAAATRRATEKELEELVGILRAIPPDALLFDECFSAYATVMIRQRVAQLAKKPVRLKWQLGAEPMPREVADAPASFRKAWKLHRAVMAPFLAAVSPLEKAGAAAKKVPRIEMDLRRVVGAPERGAWKQLAGHTWGFWCGTGSESLYHPRNRALLLSFLADGMWQEAAGAALAQVPAFGINEDRLDSVVVELLTALGLDWEQVMFGSILPISAHEMPSGRAVVSGGIFSECDAWHLLAVRGSERVVGQCLELIRRAELSPSSASDFLAPALGPEPPRQGVISVSFNRKPARSVALPEATRREVLAVFAEYLAPTNSPTDLVEAMNEVPEHCVKELREPLAVLASHHFQTVSSKAQELLRKAAH